MSDPATKAQNAFEPVARETRRFSPALFGIIVLCFLLPFLTVTCVDQEVLTLKGVDLVLGLTPEMNPEFEESFDSIGNDDLETGAGEGSDITVDESDADETDFNPVLSAIAALAAALVGLVLSFLYRDRRRTLSAAIAAGVVVLSLLYLRVEVKPESGGGGIVTLKYRFGYWIALLLGLLLLVVHGLDLRRKKPELPSVRPPSQPTRNSPPGGAVT